MPLKKQRTSIVSIAPMMKRTDRHYRFMMRQMSVHTLLYSEMITMNAILHGPRHQLLDFHEQEHPISLQVGGDDPQKLAECAKIAQDWGYDEININVGCPSERVQHGMFGACLMRYPERVAECVSAMQAVVEIPVTVKHRIGVDELDRYEDMVNFVEKVSQAGCERFTVHARKAWLKGLSPKENRNIPPLRYQDVYRLKEAFPGLFIEINGGIVTTKQMHDHLENMDAVMIGRAAYDNPYLFATVDDDFFGVSSLSVTREEVVYKMIDYAADHVAQGKPLGWISRHMLNLFAGVMGAKAWRRHLTENGFKPDATPKVLEEGLRAVAQKRL